jgi:3-hydroxybutyryl-CoA dehydratase
MNVCQTARDLSYEDISVGNEASFERTFTDADVATFAQLSGDVNPLHLDPEYAQTTKFGKPIVHGMLVGSLCSTLLGMYLPGKRCLYLKQDLIFKKPVFIGEQVQVKGTVVSKSDSTKIIEIAIVVSRDSETVLEGKAVTQII